MLGGSPSLAITSTTPGSGTSTLVPSLEWGGAWNRLVRLFSQDKFSCDGRCVDKTSKPSSSIATGHLS
jgi:hypothetical protein